MDINWELIQVVLALLALIMIFVFIGGVAYGDWLMVFVSIILMPTFLAGSMYVSNK